MPKEIPVFASDLDESDFWDSGDIEDYVDADAPGDIIEYTGPPRETVALRLDRRVSEQLEAFAERHRTSCSALVNAWVSERLQQEMHSEARPLHQAAAG